MRGATNVHTHSGPGTPLGSAWLVLRRSLNLIMLSIPALMNPTRVLAQSKPAPPDLLDMSLEELMAIEIDSVYGASGFKQKVTEAPAYVTIIWR